MKKNLNNSKVNKKYIKIVVCIVILILIITLTVYINIKKHKNAGAVENKQEEIPENIGTQIISKTNARQDESKDLIVNSTIDEIKIESAKISVNFDDTSIAIDISNMTNKTITDLKVNFILLDGSDKEITKVQGVVLSMNPLGMASIDIPVNKNLSDVKSLKIEKYI